MILFFSLSLFLVRLHVSISGLYCIAKSLQYRDFVFLSNGAMQLKRGQSISSFFLWQNLLFLFCGANRTSLEKMAIRLLGAYGIIDRMMQILVLHISTTVSWQPQQENVERSDFKKRHLGILEIIQKDEGHATINKTHHWTGLPTKLMSAILIKTLTLKKLVAAETNPDY